MDNFPTIKPVSLSKLKQHTPIINYLIDQPINPNEDKTNDKAEEEQTINESTNETTTNKPKFNKKDYMREYMRKRNAKIKEQLETNRHLIKIGKQLYKDEEIITLLINALEILAGIIDKNINYVSEDRITLINSLSNILQKGNIIINTVKQINNL